MRSFKLILIFIIIIGLAIGSYFLFGSYSDGFRAGTLIKFSKKGVLFKTYEGQLNLGMVFNDDNPNTNAVSSVWSFSVRPGEDEVVRQIEDALLSGKRVKLHYKEKFYQISIQGDTKYFVYKVDILK